MPDQDITDDEGLDAIGRTPTEATREDGGPRPKPEIVILARGATRCGAPVVTGTRGHAHVQHVPHGCPVTAVYIAAKAHPWDSDTATADPERAEPGARPIGEIVPIAEDSGQWVIAEPGTPLPVLAGSSPLTPSRWLPPLLCFVAPPIDDAAREALFAALDSMRGGSLVLPPCASFEIVEPRPCRTLLARTALGMALPPDAYAPTIDARRAEMGLAPIEGGNVTLAEYAKRGRPYMSPRLT